MKYKVRRGKNGFVNYYEITTFSRILNILASGIFLHIRRFISLHTDDALYNFLVFNLYHLL